MYNAESNAYLKQKATLIQNKKQRLFKTKSIAENKKTPKNKSSSEFSVCTPLGIRTLDPLIKSQLLYQLS